MKKICLFIKKAFGVLCAIECFVGIFLTIQMESHYRWSGILVVFVFGYFAYICLKKPKTKISINNTQANNVTPTTLKNNESIYVTEILENNSNENLAKSDSYIEAKNTLVQNEHKEIIPVTETLKNKTKENLNKLDSYTKAENNIHHTNNQPISDKEIPYLIQTGYQEALIKEKHSINPKFNRTTHEEDLSFNFIQKYGDKVSILENSFEMLYHNALKTKDLPQKITLLKETIIAYEKAKKFCYSKGKGGTIYFQDMWENLHNSHNTCFSYLEIIQDDLDEAMFEYEVIIPEILNIISQHDGILQKNIYKELSYDNKAYIQRLIRNLENDKKILRLKKSGSYELHILEGAK